MRVPPLVWVRGARGRGERGDQARRPPEWGGATRVLPAGHALQGRGWRLPLQVYGEMSHLHAVAQKLKKVAREGGKS